jgi:hypothetical protein
LAGSCSPIPRATSSAYSQVTQKLLRSRRTLTPEEQLERAADEQAKASLTLLQKNNQLITHVHQLQTAANTMLGPLEHVNAELNVIREAVAPGVPDPAKDTDADGAERC